jgi:streptomycin 6-kinase
MGAVGQLILPRNLISSAVAEGRTDWLATTLPRVIGQAAERWSLTVGAPFQPGGQCAWVAPVVGRSAGELVLKVAWPHPEADHEADGLRAWAGHGAVRLHGAQDFSGTTALLLERCVPGRPLSRRPAAEQDTVIAGLLQRLWITPAAGHAFEPLQVMCDQWADRFEQVTAGSLAPLDPGLARAGIALFRELPATAPAQVLLCTDLHAGNVLRAAREPWLAIDPKPYVGDPAYDSLQHMLNCAGRLQTDPHGLARRMAGLLGLDLDQVLLWLFARCVQESAGWPGLARVAHLLAPS